MKQKLTKNILIGAVVIIVLVVIGFIIAKKFKNPAPRTSSSSLVSETGQAPIPGTQPKTEVSILSDELFLLLGSLENLSLDDSVLFNPAFRALRDISIPLLREGNQGRPNPFSPLGVDTAASAIQALPVTTISSRAANTGATTTTTTTTTTPVVNRTTTTSSTQAPASSPASSSNNSVVDDFGDAFNL